MSCEATKQDYSLEDVFIAVVEQARAQGRRAEESTVMRRILAQARKELTQILRDRLALALALVLPLILIALLGTAISLTVTDIPIVIQDFDQTPLSRQYADAFRSSLTFRIVPLAAGHGARDDAGRGTRAAAVIIPEHFERDIRRGRDAEAQVLVDATDGNTARLIRGNASLRSPRAFAQHVGRRRCPAGRADRRPGCGSTPAASSRKFIGPGFLVLALSIFPPLLAALAMSREGEQKTILQVYVSSISAHEFLLGKILAGMVVGARRSACSASSCCSRCFGLASSAIPTPLVVGSVLYVFCMASFGIAGGRGHPQPGGRRAGRRARRLPAVVPALGLDLSDREHSRRAALDLRSRPGPLLRR